MFSNKREYARALRTLNYYRFKNLPLKLSKFLVQPSEKQVSFIEQFAKQDNKQVSLTAYCLMPNHFHFLVKQTKENGISNFLSKFTNSYTKYFNTKHERVGPLVQGVFKAVHVETDEQLLHLSRYIHLNPVTSFLIKEADLETYVWSSYPEYLGLSKYTISDKEDVLGHFKNPKAYKDFVLNQVTYAQELDIIKHLTLEPKVPS